MERVEMIMEMAHHKIKESGFEVRGDIKIYTTNISGRPVYPDISTLKGGRVVHIEFQDPEDRRRWREIYWTIPTEGDINQYVRNKRLEELGL